MEWTFNDIDIGKLYAKWAKLGWMVTDEIYSDDVDVEALIIETTTACRYDGRLLKWLMTWVRDYSDLLNKKRLMRLMDHGDTAVLGAVLEIAIEAGGEHNLKTVIAKCRPHPKAQVLLVDMEDNPLLREQEKRNGQRAFRHWGLWCSMLEFYEDAKRTRIWVLEQNRILAIRALFGVGMRSEILGYLLEKSGLDIKQLAVGVGYAYSAVHKEAGNLVKSGFIEDRTGKEHCLALSRRTRKYLMKIPV
ncbi:MAG: hypothetical protein GF344_05300 [Chitinivibrionales bacterium]|nr:hypothetical protein [Chitinivibrionales bacterium]